MRLGLPVRARKYTETDRSMQSIAEFLRKNADISAFSRLPDPVPAKFSLPDHTQFGQGLQDLGDGLFRLAFVVAGEGAGVHGGGFELVADGADLGLQRFGPLLFFGDFVFWCFGWDG